MHAMWKGSVAFGLVNVPIQLYAATEDHDVRFHQVHAADGGRVKMLRTCSIDGRPVEHQDLAKAFESESGQVVLMDDTDFDGLPVAGMREIEVLEFVPAEQVDPVLFDRGYYLEPEPRALKPYVLLREALARTERIAVVRVVLRQKTQLAALRVRGDVLVLQTLVWPDEVRPANFDVLDAEVDLRPQELNMASSLIDSLSSNFDPDEFHDEYREALLAVIDRKLAGGDGISVETAAAGRESGEGIVLDLMAALRESVQRNQAAQATTPSTAPEGGTTAKKRTAAAKSLSGVKRTTKATAKKATAATSRKATTGGRVKKAATASKPEPKVGRRRSA